MNRQGAIAVTDCVMFVKKPIITPPGLNKWTVKSEGYIRLEGCAFKIGKMSHFPVVISFTSSKLKKEIFLSTAKQGR